jgi:hypothetical protein
MTMKQEQLPFKECPVPSDESRADPVFCTTFLFIPPTGCEHSSVMKT